jgi:hypothetical protein
LQSPVWSWRKSRTELFFDLFLCALPDLPAGNPFIHTSFFLILGRYRCKNFHGRD